MKYIRMLPFQLEKALRDDVPVLLPVGVIEYHSRHLPFGVDGLIVEGVLDRLEQRHPDCVVLPPFHYGTASCAVAGPAKGTCDVDSRKVGEIAEEILGGLLRIGFRNIHVFYSHQTENFLQGMPTDLAFRFAGRRAIFAYLEETRGKGWWGNREMQNYYRDDKNIFDWIQVHVISEGIRARFGGDHAGKVETSAIMEMFPELVHMELHTAEDWFAEPALEASKDFGARYVDAIVEHFEQSLFTPAVPPVGKREPAETAVPDFEEKFLEGKNSRK